MGRTNSIVAFTFVSLILALVAGCRSGAPVITAEDHLSELEFEKSRALVALRETVVLDRSNSASLKVQEDEKEALLSDLTRKEAELRYANDQVRKLSTENEEAEKSLAELRESERKVKEAYEKLKDLAFNSTQEVSVLKTRAEAAVQDKAKLAGENKTLITQLATAAHEIEELQGELTRTRAAVRSLQQHGPVKAGSEGEAAALRTRIEELERSLADAIASSPTAQTASTAAPPVARDTIPDQKAIWRGLAALLQERVRDAAKGQFKWDAFEWTLVGILSSFFLLFMVALIARMRGRRLRRQLAELMARGGAADDDLERAVDAAGIGEESQSSHAGSSTKLVEEAPAKAANRRSTYLPREDRDFSAIISTPRARKERAEPAPAEAPPASKPLRAREEKASARTGDARSSRERDPLSAGLANVRPAPEARAQARPKPSIERVRAGAGSEEEPGEDADRANTQIISPLRSGELHFVPGVPAEKDAEKAESGVEEKGAGTEGEDKILLDELKEIINKKFDELMRK